MLSFGMEYDLRLLDRVLEREVAGRIAAALLRRHDDRARELREELAALRVRGALLVLDRRPLAMPGHRRLPSPVQKELVHPRVVRQLRMERGDEDPAFARQHGVPVELGEHLDPGAGLLDPRRADEDAAERLLACPSSRSVSKLRDLAPERVAPTFDVGERRDGRGRAGSSPRRCRRSAARTRWSASSIP